MRSALGPVRLLAAQDQLEKGTQIAWFAVVHKLWRIEGRGYVLVVLVTRLMIVTPAKQSLFGELEVVRVRGDGRKS